jgi:hypothetical protein
MNAMKTRRICSELCLLTLLIIFVLPVRAKTLMGTEKTISREMAVKPAGMITMENKMGPVTVNTWDKQAAKIDIHVVIDGDPGEVEKVLNYIQKLNFSQSGDNISFNTKFYKRWIGNFPGNFRVTLNDGTTVKLTKLDLEYTLTVPKNNPMKIINAYDNVVLPDLSGKLILELYESDLTAGILSNDNEISIKYGNAEIDSLRDAVLELYESKLKVGRTGNLKVNSKYSGLSIGRSGNLILDCYEDKVTATRHGDLTAQAKYTTLTLGDFNKGTFDLYECTLRAGHSSIVAIATKYCEVEFLSSRAVVFTEAYETKFVSGSVGDLKASSKYSTFNLRQLSGKLTMLSSYEDRITVTEAVKPFAGIDLNGKYTDLEISFAAGIQYRLTTDFNYTDFDFPKSRFREIRYYKENNQFTYDGIIEGADESTCPVVNLVMYEGKAVIR